MLPQFSAIPLQSTETASDSSRNLSQLLPVGKNVSATVVAISRDQIQPDIFRLKLEINNRLIQMGVFQALPVGQKININRQSDGQIQITPQSASQQANPAAEKNTAQILNTQQQAGARQSNTLETNIRLQASNFLLNAKLPDNSSLIAAVISSRPVYPQPTISGATTPPANPPGNASAQITQPSTLAPGQATNPAQNVSQTVTQTPLQSTTQANSSPPVQTPAQPSQTNPSGAIERPNIQGQIRSGGTAPQTTPQVAQTISNGASAISTTPQQSNPTTPTQPPPSANPAATESARPAQAASNTQSAQPNTATQAQTTVTASLQAQPRASEQNSTATVQTTVTAPTPPRISPPPVFHAITLALPDGSKLEMNAAQPLPQGAQVVLQKTSPQEAIISKVQLPNISPASALDKPAIQEILRNSLPTQIPVGDAFSQLAQSAAAAQGAQVTQISSVVRSMLQLFGVSPGSPEASSQIRQNIELGGLGTERNLSEGKAINPQDMKSQLQQLQNLADRLPTEQRERFEQLLRGLHSRITSQQLNSLQQWRELPDGGFERVLQLDLPVKQGDKWDNLELRLSREGGSNAAGELVSIWRVRLHFDLDELGGVDAEVRLSDGHDISTYFWCDKPDTAEKLRARADDFAERLRECGFSNSEVQWQQGSAPEQKQTVHRQLVDLHT